MDSHTFTEPELVSRGDDGVEPSSSPAEPEPSFPALEWRVHVLRQGVPEPIGSILINSSTLPPRRNKAGKIVWKLPDEPNQVPKFGIHEQKRLWELYKDQKKQRRKKQSVPQEQSKGSEAQCGDQEAKATTVSPSPPQSAGRPPQSDECTTTVVDNPKNSPYEQTSVSPPPGFGATGRLESLSLEETASRRTDNPQLFQQQSTPQRNNLSGSHVPPPPGLAVAGASPSVTNGNHTSLSQSPSRVGQAKPSNYFALSSAVELASFPQSLAALVALSFQRLISVVGAPDGVAEWLSYYSPNARSTLIMGTAQAVASTHDERWRQWQSLSPLSAAGTTADEAAVPVGNDSAGKRWECSGWTAQAVVAESDTLWPPDVLIVLAGRTLQQHLLSFNLTLLLTCKRPTQVNGGVPPLTFQISNEILALALLT
jgi:hypothetical protein